MFFLFKWLGITKTKTTNAAAGKITDIDFARADEGSPVPRWYGTNKFSGLNTIWDGDFKAIPIKKKEQTGIFSSKKVIVGYNYQIGLDMAVCLGPGFTFRRIWADTYEIWNDCLTTCFNTNYINYPDLFGGADQSGGWWGTIAMYCGDYDQPQDSYLQAQIFPENENQVPAYPGIAHLVCRGCVMGNSTSIKNLIVEGSCFYDTLGLNGYHIMSNGYDMNPVSILHHIATDEWGCLDVDGSKINLEQWKAVALTVFNEGMGSSVVVSGADSAKTTWDKILDQIAATVVENPATGLWEIILIRNDYAIADLPIIGPDQYSSITDFTKTLWSSTYNTVRVTFTDRSQGYKESTVATAQDFSNIRFQGKVLAQAITGDTIKDPDTAAKVAARELSNINTPLYSGQIVMDRTEAALVQGGVFKLNAPEYGIVEMVMRIQKFNKGTLEKGSITLDVVQDIFALDNVITAIPVKSPATVIDTSPAAIVSYSIFDLPYWFDYVSSLNSAAGYQSIGVFALAPTTHSIGFNANIGDAEELDTVDYTTTAKLIAALDQFDGFVSGIMPTLAIGGLTDATILTTGDAANGNGIFMLNGEIMAYETFVANGDATYTLKNVHRALLDSIYTAGAIGDLLYFFDGQEAFFPETFAIGTALSIDLADVTSTGVYGSQAPIAYSPAARASLPLPPDGLAIGGVRAKDSAAAVGEAIALSWVPRSASVDPSRIAGETDAAQASGSLYRVAVSTAGGADVILADDVAGSSADIAATEAMRGASVLKVWAKSGSTLSFNPAIYPIAVGDVLTIDGNELLIDSGKVIL